MKTSLMIVAALALVAVGLNHAGVMPTEAEAAPKWQAALTVTDAGFSSNVVAMPNASKFQTISLQPVTTAALPNGNAFCVKTCATSTCVADCTKDKVLNIPTVTYQSPDGGSAFTGYTIVNPPAPLQPIQMGNDLYVAVGSMDAGNPNVNLYLETLNPSTLRP